MKAKPLEIYEDKWVLDHVRAMLWFMRITRACG